MKADTLVHQHPPTPPNMSHDVQTGLHHIAQYNAVRSYSYDGSPTVTYSSPGPIIYDSLPGQPSHIDHHHNGDFGLGIQYDGQDHNAYYSDSPYNGLQNMYSSSPLTPRSTIENDGLSRRSTRSGRPLEPSSSPLEDEKPKPRPRPSKSKKSKANKPGNKDMPKLQKPLSVLTEDMVDIPIRDMEAWVNRPPEVRRQEVEKRNGYVTRPMNSFMLYRSAYAERTKVWCLQNNHQVVSSISGESWPMEPPEIRELYNEYAKIERFNHQSAHPKYKFSPSKPAAQAKKRKHRADEEEPSDLDTEWPQDDERKRSRSRSSYSRPPPERALSYPTGPMNQEYFDRPFNSNDAGLDRSSWDMTNDGRSATMPMTPDDLYNQYFTTTVHPSMGMNGGVVEDLRLRRVDTPISSMQFPSDHSLLGLPGGDVNDLMNQMHSHNGTPLADNQQVDPMLLGMNASHQHDIDPTVVQHPEYRNGHAAIMDQELDHNHANNLLGVVPPPDDFSTGSWHPDPNMGALEPESEFEKWMGDH